MRRFSLRRLCVPLVAASFLLPGPGFSPRADAQGPIEPAAAAPAPPVVGPPIFHKVEKAADRIEMTVNTSRRLTLDRKIPEAQVNNPEILELTPISPTEVQITAVKPGVTSVNLFDEDNKTYTIDVIVYADARELIETLRAVFPGSSLKVMPVGTSVMITGFVDQPGQIDTIIKLAEQYYPQVINNIEVSGVQQVMLHVKVMEVSRTKLRRMGFDFAKITGNNMFVSAISGLITAAGAGGVTSSGNETIAFSIIDGSSAFFGILEALRQDDLAKILAEPTLTTVSGRPAYFNSGGEFPIPVPESLGTLAIEYKKFGTQIDFVPIVLGNGRIRLEVRPRVSEIDNSRGVTIAGTTVPGLKIREVETGVEMQAGQTLALAGLVQYRSESQFRGLPWISEVPYLGAAFRRVEHEMNEVELLILVTPELVDPLDAHQVANCGPGMSTTDPTDFELFWKGSIEVPACCPSCQGAGCSQCAAGGGESPEGASQGDPSIDGLPPGAVMIQQQDEVRSGPRGTPVSQRMTTVAHDNSQGRGVPSGPSSASGNAPPAFIGPIGYDVVK